MSTDICEKIYEELIKNYKINNSFYNIPIQFNRLGGWQGEIRHACEFLNVLSVSPTSHTVYRILEMRKNLIELLSSEDQLIADFSTFQEKLREKEYIGGCGVPAPLLWVYNFLRGVFRRILNKTKRKKEVEIKNIIENVDRSIIYNFNFEKIEKNSQVHLVIKDIENFTKKEILKEE